MKYYNMEVQKYQQEVVLQVVQNKEVILYQLIFLKQLVLII